MRCFDLIIIFKSRPDQPVRINPCTEYGFCTTNPNMFYFTTDNQRTFIPVDSILYFGEPVEGLNNLTKGGAIND